MWGAVLITVVAAIAVACGGGDDQEPPDLARAAGEAVSSGNQGASGPSVAKETPVRAQTTAATDPAYNPSATMRLLFSGPDHPAETTKRGLDETRTNSDELQVVTIVELIRFRHFRERRLNPTETLKQLTGQQFGAERPVWFDWMKWLGERADEYPAPDGYVQWKIDLLSLVHPRFAELLETAETTAQLDLKEVVWGGVSPDGIPDLQMPPVLMAREASYLQDDERVFGVSINGEDRAYPIRIMNSHEMANDVLGGEHIALAYCTLCGSAIAYSAMVNGEPTTFGTSGLIYRSNKLMYDRATQTIWHQFTGEPMIGPLADSGIRLSFYPVEVTDWYEWRKQHPKTTVLDIETGVLPVEAYKHELDPQAIYYDFFYNSDDTMFPVWNNSNQLKDKEQVLGLSVGDAHKAYQVKAIKRARVINDLVGEEGVVVMASSYSDAARVYERSDHDFTLGPRETQPGDIPGELQDSNGVVWEVTEEFLVNKNDPSQKLARIPTHNAFWFGWSSFHPDTELYALDQE